MGEKGVLALVHTSPPSSKSLAVRNVVVLVPQVLFKVRHGKDGSVTTEKRINC